ncbi:MAG TPA: hypothetical protein VD867_00815, partial [Burkholderiales bacterium]|nr:hypothetical protein [Burkholderiales bacterium]
VVLLRQSGRAVACALVVLGEVFARGDPVPVFEMPALGRGLSILVASRAAVIIAPFALAVAFSFAFAGPFGLVGYRGACSEQSTDNED